MITRYPMRALGAAVLAAGLAFAVAASRATATSPEPRPSHPQEAAPQEAGKARKFTKPSDEQLRERLTPEQYRVTQHEGTEPPFRNAYWDEHRPGLYVDVVSGEPLFSSLDKFESGTGWPSFTKPLDPAAVTARTDHVLFYARTEVRSKGADSHLGHVFDDGPPPTGKRYCINSAALRFIPAERLAEEGYGEYASLFRTASHDGRAHP